MRIHHANDRLIYLPSIQHRDLTMKFRVIVPVYVGWDEIEVVVDHEGGPDSDEEIRSEIYDKAIQVAIRERPLVPWMAEEKAMLYDIVPDMSRLIRRIE